MAKLRLKEEKEKEAAQGHDLALEVAAPVIDQGMYIHILQI